MKFNNKKSDGQSLIPIINLILGDVTIGVELGVDRGHTFCSLLQSCPSIYTLYGVDSYQPYVDHISYPVYEVDAKQIADHKQAAFDNISTLSIELQSKAIMLVEDSNIAVKRFEDHSIDFIFIDTYMTKEQATNDFEQWYSKVKSGGLFAGHDWTSPAIRDAVRDFRKKHDIKNKMSKFDNTWMWIK